MRREQQTGKPGYPCGEPLETGRRKGVRSIAILQTAEKNGASVLRRLGNITKRYKNFERKRQNRRVPNGTHGGVRGRLLN